MSKRAKPQAAPKAAALESASAPAAPGQKPDAASTVQRQSQKTAAIVQSTNNDAALNQEALKLIAGMLGEPESVSNAGQPEAPGGDEADEARTEPILTPEADEAEDDEGGDADEAEGEETPSPQPSPPVGETEEGEPNEEPAAELDDGDLDELSELTEEQLNAHASAHEWPPSYLKRVKKFTRQLKAARAQADNADQLRQEREALQARLAELEGTDRDGAVRTPGPAEAGPTSHPELEKFDRQLADIDREIAQMDRNLAWAKANPAGGTLRDSKGNPMEVDAEYVERWVEASSARARQLERESNRLVSRREARAAALESEAQARVRALEQRAFTAYPWLKDQKSAEWKQAKKFMDENPGFDLLPNWPLLLGQLVTGKAPAALNGNGNGHGQAGAARRPVPAARVPGRPGATPAAVSERDAGVVAAHRKVLETGSAEDATRLLAKLI